MRNAEVETAAGRDICAGRDIVYGARYNSADGEKVGGVVENSKAGAHKVLESHWLLGVEARFLVRFGVGVAAGSPSCPVCRSLLCIGQVNLRLVYNTQTYKKRRATCNSLI